MLMPQPEERGLTFVEVMIAASFVLLSVAVAVPHYARSRMAKNEVAAVNSLREVYQAELAYQATYPKVGFPENIRALGGAAPCKASEKTACLIANSVAAGLDNGFHFAAKGETPINGANTTFTAGAAPETVNGTGTHLFCTMQDGKIRWDNNLAESSTPPDTNLCPQFRVL